MKFDASEVPKEKSFSGVFKDFDVPTARIPFKLLRDRRVRDKAVRLYGIYFEEAENWRGTVFVFKWFRTCLLIS